MNPIISSSPPFPLLTGNSNTSEFRNPETVEFAGQAVANLAASGRDSIMSRSGKIVMTCDLAREFDFYDDDGDQKDYR